MNVAFYVISTDPSRGGIEKVTYAVSKALHYKGIKVYAICIQKPDNAEYLSHYEKVRCLDLIRDEDIDECIAFLQSERIDILVNQWSGFRETLRFEEKLYESNIRHVNCIHGRQYGIINAYSFYRNLHLPRIVEKWLFFFYKYSVLYLRNVFAERRHYKYSDITLLLCKPQIEEYRKIFFLPDKKKLRYIHNPVPFTKEISDSTVRYDDRQNIFLYIGRIEKTKRISVILKFWEKYGDSYPDYKLMIVGDGPDKDRLRDFCERKECRNVIWVGRTEDPIRYYRKSKLLLMTSRSEGFAMTILESMSAGCVPIVMDTFVAAHVIIRDKVSGMLTKNMNLKDYNNAVAYALQHFDFMSEEAIKKSKEFSIDIIINDWINLFNELCPDRQ